MFTGIIEEVGTIARLQPSGGHCCVEITCRQVLDGVKLGDSIAVNGVCLTVTAFGASSFSADISNESLRVTALGRYTAGDRVNLERAMAANGRFDGHMVAGHVDTTATLVDRSRDGSSWRLRFRLAHPQMMRYVIERGSVAIDGISLTVFGLDDSKGEFSINLIPHSQGLTILPEQPVGAVVNIECDLVAKYLERLMGGSKSDGASPSTLTMEKLRANGFG
ncbi:riboflavin synthase [Desulfurispira natronophila]|uniref:Riboflavin synthase n=1 Tax=Desulfurispira natronophila TaxID=682562 RepID=A0A7W7Y4K4_9BACT|nr:riboflavin synthase [Desulfurispira natronophila]MBB5021907.1 riboflavin synthase [Desulfurispira natronophila]